MKKIFPQPQVVKDILKRLQSHLFPAHFPLSEESTHNKEAHLAHTLFLLETQIACALAHTREDRPQSESPKSLVADFQNALPALREMLLKDAKAGFDGDPAAHSADEVILAYPGFFAILAYRLAHVLYSQNIPLIPRLLSEYAHSKTGIDIHPGATIGKYFFIDHGTGVVIGETVHIGNHVKLYQGVTLGALSTRKGQALFGEKRHPTLEDHVTVYAGATILGGQTVIGKNAVIGGNVFIMASVPAGSKMST